MSDVKRWIVAPGITLAVFVSVTGLFVAGSRVVWGEWPTMSEPIYPWWMAIWFFVTGGGTAWLFAIATRPGSVQCPNCEMYVKNRQLRDHWKACI